MPHCTNCRNNVEKTWNYCGQCGNRLADIKDDPDKIPPSPDAAGRLGFLSGRSTEYISQVLEGEQALDTDQTGFAQLSRDTAAAFADFAYVGTLDELSLFALFGDQSSGNAFSSDSQDKRRPWRVDEELMWHGFLAIPRLYDQSLGTEWGDELDQALVEIAEKIEGRK